ARQTQAAGVSQVIVYQRATLPQSTISPRVMINVAIAVLFGLFLGIALAFLRNYLDDTLKTEEDVRKYMRGLPVLGAIPMIPGNHRRSARDRSKAKDHATVAVAKDPKSSAAEGFRTLRTNLQFLSANPSFRSLVITSPTPAEGKSTISVNLAASMAQVGQKVVLIDADLRRPSLHYTFSRRMSPGLSNYLVGKADLATILQETTVPNLKLIASGPLPPMPAELLASVRMQVLLAELAGQTEMVIIDTPPAIAVSDAAILATQVDGIVMVITCGRTTRDQARAALQALENAGVKPLGVVMNQVDRRKGYGYYYFYYRRYYPSVQGNTDTGIEGIANETSAVEGAIFPQPASIREEPVQAAAPPTIHIDWRKASPAEVLERCDNLVREGQLIQAISFLRPFLDQPGLSSDDKQYYRQRLASLLSALRSNRLAGDLTTHFANEEPKTDGSQGKTGRAGL
ncbi:MAG: polysaccharide biosynthesis tyrosine autokinase, partial [bacterium]